MCLFNRWTKYLVLCLVYRCYSFFFFKFCLFIFGCAGSSFLHRFSLVVASEAHSVAVPRFLSLVAFLAGEQGLWGTQASVAGARGLSSCSSWALEHRAVVVVHRLSCSPACGIFLDQGLSYCIGRQILCH